MNSPVPESAPVHVEPLLRALDRQGIRYVLTGSVAAMAYGVSLVPGDLDIAPALTVENLRLCSVLLKELGAKPKHIPTWSEGLTLEECEKWVPDPPTEQNLDHRFVTAHGELDLVLRHAGTYERLITRAVPMTVFDSRILVAHIDDLIALCEKWNRDTDRRRLPGLVAARDALGKRGPR